MYHLGRPGHELVYLQRVFHAWGIDGHNSHTNVCSASARAGYAFWHGMDRPSPDHANARFILLLSSHLETGHYFNPHAQRIMEAQDRAAPRWRHRHAAVQHRLDGRLVAGALARLARRPCCSRWPTCSCARSCYDREFVRRWVNWEEYLREERPDLPRRRSRRSSRRSTSSTRAFTPEFAEAGERRRRRDDRRGRPRDRPRRLGAGDPRLAQHRRRQSRRLAGGARARAPGGAHGRGRHARRHRAQRLEQGDPGAADDAAARRRSGASS